MTSISPSLRETRSLIPDRQPAKFGNRIGEAVETLVLNVEALIDRCEMLADEPVLVVEALVDRCEMLADESVLSVKSLVLGVKTLVLSIEALVDRCEELADEPVLRDETLILSVEAVAVDGHEADEGGKGNQGVAVRLEVGPHQAQPPGGVAQRKGA